MIQRKRKSRSMDQAPARKRGKYRQRYSGLVPTYRGFVPRQFAKGEWKYLDTTLNPLVSNTPTITILNGLVPGSGASQRIGMKVSIRTIELRGWVESYPGTGLEQIDRVAIILDRQPNGVGPTAVTDFLQIASVASPRNLANRKRFKVIWDRMFGLGATAVASGTLTVKTFNKYIRFRKPLVVDYNSGTAISCTKPPVVLCC